MPTNDPFLSDSQTDTISDTKLQEPVRYVVLLHNDDYTSMEFVVGILRRIFHKNIEEATRIMMTVHKHGIGECGVYTREVAETKVGRVLHDARMAGFPLMCTMEKA